jgi:hypothetical protein
VNTDQVALGERQNGLERDLRELRAHEVVDMHEGSGPRSLAVAAVKHTVFRKKLLDVFAATEIPEVIEPAQEELFILFER